MEIINTWAILHLPLWLKNRGRSVDYTLPISFANTTQTYLFMTLTVPPNLVNPVLSDTLYHLVHLELDEG